MNEGRRLIEQLRDVFRDGVDDLERTGGEHIDRWVRRGSEQWNAHREEARNALNSRSSRKEGRRRAARPGKRRTKKRADHRDLDPEEIEYQRIVRVARSRANRRIGFFSHFVSYVSVLAIILVATRSIRVAMIVALAWGIAVAIHYFAAIVAPSLRDRWIRNEVGARSPDAVASERQKVGTRSRRSMEDLSASIAHEIRNPITAAKSLVQQMGEDPASSENIEYAEVALGELDRVERSISHLLRYAREEEPRFETLALKSIALAAVEGLSDRATSVGVDLRVDFDRDRDGEIRGDPEKLRRVFENLISNALDALEAHPVEGARIEILGGENFAGSEVWIRVIDNGPGIPAEDRDRIWSPFHTTKESGAGLGLALSRKTVEAHGGRMELEADRVRGAEFVLSFPTLLDSNDRTPGHSDQESDDAS